MDLTEQFADLVRSPSFPLDEAALLIAAHGDPACDVNEALARIDRLAGLVPGADVEALVATLFGREGFVGDRLDYYNPRNSYLHAVLERRRGIPITLSVLAMEVGRRVGVTLEGVATPVHFLVRVADRPDLYVDPFDRGRILEVCDLAPLFDDIAPGVDIGPHLSPTEPVRIVARMLTNLVAVHQRRGDRHNLLWAAQLRTLLPGATADDRRTYGGALAACGDFGRAASVLEQIVADGLSSDLERDRRRIHRLRARLN